MKSMRWSKFWWQDYERDPALRGCSLASQGLWMRMLCFMHEAEPYGHLLINGRAPDAKRLAAMIGKSEREVKAALDELDEAGVFSRTDDDVIFSRRLVRDKAASDVGRANGLNGGNPALKPTENGADKPPPTEGGLTPPVKPPSRGEVKLQEAESEDKKERGSLRSPARARAARSDPEFAEFYAAYPKHEAPDDALKAWRSVRSDGASAAEIMAGLARHVFSPEHRYIPQPARWLRAGRWKDAAPPRQAPRASSDERLLQAVGLWSPDEHDEHDDAPSRPAPSSQGLLQ